MGCDAWLEERSEAIPAEGTAHPLAAALVASLRLLPPDIAELREVRVFRNTPGFVVIFEAGVERPQVRELDIRARELIAVVFGERDLPPTVLALRPDFPDTPHQNFVPDGVPAALCVDDRPWAEAKPGFTGYDLVERIRSWLARAARGELVDRAQPADPFFLATHGTLIVPSSLLAGAQGGARHAGAVRLTEDDAAGPVYQVTDGTGKEEAKLLLVALRAQPRPMARLRRAPPTIGALHRGLEPFGIDLLGALRERVRACAGMGSAEKSRLAGLLAVLIEFPITDKDGHELGLERRAFFSLATLGGVGEAIGVLASGGDHKGAYLPLLLPDLIRTGEEVGVEVMQVHAAFTRELAAEASGLPTADDRDVVLVGAGSLGSQVAATLAREGTFRWTVIDDDILLPHNFARHALLPFQAGKPKAKALAGLLRHLSGDREDCAAWFVADFLDAEALASGGLRQALDRAGLVLDCSASVAVARALADDPADARRISLFFNPTGTAGVLLAEDDKRNVTLRDLEAQYYRLILREPSLAGHLRAMPGMSYSGSCRALSARIPQHRAGMLSALLAGEVRSAADSPNARIEIWTVGAGSAVTRSHAGAEAVERFTLAGGWTLLIDQGTLDSIQGMRQRALPDETGGVLVGIADFADRSVRIVEAIGPMDDSKGSPTGFLRGTKGLPETMRRIGDETALQVRYVGEWHTHPRGASSFPSGVDLTQLLHLRSHLAVEGLPPVMLIAGERRPSIVSVH